MTNKKKIFLALALLSAIFVLLEGIGYYIATSVNTGITPENKKSGNLKQIEEKNRILKSLLKSLSPKGVYIVVDSARNRLYLKDGGKTLKEAVVSCGSGNILEDPSGKNTWVFDTPKGEFSVKSKHVKPDWIKPDWAFIEEGDPLPLTSKERIESGVLGDYALGFGDGYFIHGTLYTRLLGRNVTHGCIRVGDKDLEILFKTTPIGAKVMIF